MTLPEFAEWIAQRMRMSASIQLAIDVLEVSFRDFRTYGNP